MDQPHLSGTDIPGDLLPLPQGRYLRRRDFQNLALGDDVLDDVTRVPPEPAVLADRLVQLQGKAAGRGAGCPWGYEGTSCPPAPGNTQAQPRGCCRPRPLWGPAVTSPVTEEELDASQGDKEQHDEAQQVQPVAPLEGHLWDLWGHTRGSSTPRPAVARGTPSTGEPTQPHVPCPAPLTMAAQDPEKGDMGATPLASLVPIGDMRCSAPCPSYLVCPCLGPAASSASPSACTGEAGAGANRAVAAEQVLTGDPVRLPGDPRARGRVTGQLDGVASRGGHGAALWVEKG